MNARDDRPDEPADDWLRLSEPDHGELEAQLVQAALAAPRWSSGRLVEHFEAGFAAWLGRAHAVAVPSGTLGTWLALRALGIGPGDEVIASTYGWHQVGQAVALAGAKLVFSDIHYWSGCLDPARAAAQVTPATKARTTAKAVPRTIHFLFIPLPSEPLLLPPTTPPGCP